MAVNNIWLFSWHQHGSTTKTFDVFMAPQLAVATASLSWVSGGGLHLVGIAGVRTRPTPAGVEQAENFGNLFQWPPNVFRERMSQVTFGIATGSNQELKAHFEVFLF